MSALSQYWILVTIDGFGKCRTSEVEEAKVFFYQQFPALANQGQENLPHRDIQRQLVQLLQSKAIVSLQEDDCWRMTKCCLRCFISNQMKQVCLELERKFGDKHDFKGVDLLPMVLDRTRSLRINATDGVEKVPDSLTTRILHTFDPNKSNLSTWTTRMVKSDKEVRRFLLEHGIEQVTDWSILNRVTSGGLERILSEFYQRTSVEIEQAVQLLDSYHQVYRAQILKQRRQQGKAGVRSKYPPPSDEQLRQIAKRLSVNSEQEVLQRLQELAKLLREYRIYKRGGVVPIDYLDGLGTRVREEAISSVNITEDKDELTEALGNYLYPCLLQAVEQVIINRVNYLQNKNPQKAENFLKALHLFHCQGVAMAEIATQLSFNAQYQVTRLLELKTFRADIRQKTLLHLRDRIFELVQKYRNPDSILDLEQKVTAFLEPQIDKVIQEAKKEASTSKNRVMNSQLSQTVCQYLDTRRKDK
ncbi:MAG: hypothetical protein F6K58_13920 [Symploca sp. SIO2E9]|nr:hypothetical protein [Symploca sp. SIO2E9]